MTVIQCGQMARFCFQFWPFKTMKVWPMAYFCYIYLKFLPNTYWALKKLPKAFKTSPKWRNFAHPVWLILIQLLFYIVFSLVESTRIKLENSDTFLYMKQVSLAISRQITHLCNEAENCVLLKVLVGHNKKDKQCWSSLQLRLFSRLGAPM